MSRKLLFRPQVAADIAETVAWYAFHRPGLETDFVEDFHPALATIERNPFQYQIVEREIRRATLRRFPYGVMYVVSDQELLIVACLHGRRNPANWRRRLG
jgi:plasmid stabilization system protein ParE